MHERIKIMNCENCKYYERHYSYSKEHGFVYLYSGSCSKNLNNNPDDCYFFEKENCEIVKEENLSLTPFTKSIAFFSQLSSIDTAKFLAVYCPA